MLFYIVHYIWICFQISQPISPSAADFEDLDTEVSKKQEEQEKRPLINYEVVKDIDPYEDLRMDKRIFKYIFDPLSINPQSWQMTILIGIQTIVLMYNAWSVPFGLSFTFYRVRVLRFIPIIHIRQAPVI